MSAASLVETLNNVAQGLDRVRIQLAEARTREEILEVRERAEAALGAAIRLAAAAKRLDEKASRHGALSGALGQLMEGAAEIIDLADAKLEPDSIRSPPGG
jgi:hypothetical protein